MTSVEVDHEGGLASVDVRVIWSEIEPHLYAYLRMLDATDEQAREFIQEAFVRALTRRRRPFTSWVEVLRWAKIVVANLLTDQRREAKRCRPLVDAAGEELDLGASEDAARHASRRMALEAALREVSLLSEADREAMASVFDESDVEAALGELRFLMTPGPHTPMTVASETGDGSRREAVRLAMRRLRVRARLAEIVEGILGWWGAAKLRLQPWVKGAAVGTTGSLIAVLAVLQLFTITPKASGPKAAPMSTPPMCCLRQQGDPQPGRFGSQGPPSVLAAKRRESVIPVPPAADSHVVVDAVYAPRDLGLRIKERPPTDKALVCVANVAGLPRTCVDQPTPPDLSSAQPTP